MANHEKMWQELGLDVELHNELLKSIDRTFQQTVGAQKNRPEGMKYFDNVLHESHGGRVAELLDVKAKGNKVIGTFCIYVPDEIAMAVDITPIALCGGTNFSVPYAEKMFPRDICPLVKSTLGLAFSKTCPYAPIKNMAVGETTCDAKKKTWEILAGKVNFHVMEVPQKKEEPDIKLWHKEVREFKDKVEGLAGKKVESKRLAETIEIMNDKRRALQKLNELRKHDPPPISGLDALVVMQAALNDEPVRFTETLNQLNDELEERIEKGISPFTKGVKRIMIAGCPAVMGNWKVHWLVETSGAAIVGDETCTGSRYFENLVDETAKDLVGQLSALAERYMKINCACFTPNTDRIEGVVKKAKESNVQGVVQYILQYCHGYNVEAIRVDGALKQANIPSLKIETDYSEEDVGPLRTRVEAFLERLG
ncbi:MAG: double-cubane-cluster-containing anaerobic reductase [candidate division WOR-3 bacterium]|nr:double-cubane-cluster-containing anaerobic reductase [candidate division WOR-3 bacterium]MDH5682963.1 double-cubane-cluster-containing anaerobic reductase [candidate division WOR-3 bacterium]